MLCGIFWAFFAVSSTAHAELPADVAAERVLLAYEASSGCPSEAAFGQEVSARIRRPVEWVRQPPGRLISVSVVLTEEQATGRLEIIQSSAEPTRREFVARTCAEVSSALALVVALTLDPNARTEPLLEPFPAGPAATPPVTAPASLPPARANTTAPETVRARRSSLHFFIGPLAGISTGYAPEALITLGGTLGVRSSSESWLAPSLWLTPLWGKTGTTGPTVANATFGWGMLRLEACPAHFALSSALALVPCGTVEVGQLTARGQDGQVESPTEARRFWAAAGLSLGLQYSTGGFFSGVSAQALAPLSRDEFVFVDPDRTIHRASVLSFGASLSFGLELGP